MAPVKYVFKYIALVSNSFDDLNCKAKVAFSNHISTIYSDDRKDKTGLASHKNIKQFF